MIRKQSRQDEIPLSISRTVSEETKSRFDSFVRGFRNEGNDIEKRSQRKEKTLDSQRNQLKDLKQFKMRSLKKLSTSTQMLISDDDNSVSSEPDLHEDVKDKISLGEVSSVYPASNYNDDLHQRTKGEYKNTTNKSPLKATEQPITRAHSSSNSPLRPLPSAPKRHLSTQDESQETTSSRVSSPDSVMTAIEAASPQKSPLNSLVDNSSFKEMKTEEYELKLLKGFTPSYEEIDEIHPHKKLSRPSSSELNFGGMENAASYEEILDEPGKRIGLLKIKDNPKHCDERRVSKRKDTLQQLSFRSTREKDDTNTETTSSYERVQFHSKKKRPTGQSRKRSKSQEKNVAQTYTYEKIIGITVHRCDTLKIDSLIRHPMVRVHILDTLTGEYLKKSQKDRDVSFYQEEPNIDYIQPIMTYPCTFKDPRSLTPIWEETILFNDDIKHIQQPKSSILILFEVLDCVSLNTAIAQYQKLGCDSGWHRIAWAFLKPCGQNNISNIDKRVRLQLYKPQTDKTCGMHNICEKCDVYRWWSKGGWVHYPSSLHVTINSFPMPSEVTPATRSYFALQPELCLDAQQIVTDTLNNKVNEECSGDSASIRSSSNDRRLSRLPSQSCKIPNEKLSCIPAGFLGSFSTCFSRQGQYLAITEDNRDFHSICVYRVSDRFKVARFQGHPGLVYSLDWSMNDEMLLSSSADCTACIWSLKGKTHMPSQMLPHPSFVYCAIFLPMNPSSLVTGCCDHVVRVWGQQNSTHSFELLQELNSHNGFVSTLSVDSEGNLFSGDSLGKISVWQCGKEGTWAHSRLIAVRELDGIVLSHLIVHPRGKRLLVLARDSLLRMVDISTGVAIQWFKGALNHRIYSKACITPCGGLVFAPSEDGTFYVWNADTGMLLASYTALFRPVQCLSAGGTSACKSALPLSILSGAISFHPFEHMAVFAVYGIHAPVVICNYCKDSVGKNIGLQITAGKPDEYFDPKVKTKSFKETALVVSNIKTQMKVGNADKTGGHLSLTVDTPISQSEYELSSPAKKEMKNHLSDVIQKLDYVLHLSKPQTHHQRIMEILENQKPRKSNIPLTPSGQACPISGSEKQVKEIKCEVVHSDSDIVTQQYSKKLNNTESHITVENASSYHLGVSSLVELQYVTEKQPPRPMPRSKKIKLVKLEKRQSQGNISTTDTSFISSDNESSSNSNSVKLKSPNSYTANEKSTRNAEGFKSSACHKVRVISQNERNSSLDWDSDV